MKALLLLLVLLAGAGGGAWWWFYGQPAAEVSPLSTIRFAEVTQQPISVTVNATGQIQPVTQVDVGTQVSGTLQEILVDFNSRVKAGQLLARLNTDNLMARVAQNRANLKRAEAALNRLKVEQVHAIRQAERQKDLREQGIVPQVDLENAEMTRDSLEVQIRVASAEIEQASTTLRQSEIDLEHATILSPIDGVVIQRAVEVGQTVAANFNSPLLFQIANDLTQLQIRASIDEADIGRIQRCLSATFTVDAFAGRVFPAKLEQIRLNPTVTNNVVIYTCIFRVENLDSDGKVGPLLPGLTANLTILVDHREQALAVPAAALRFQPKGIPGVPSASASPRQPSEAAASRPSGAPALAGDGAPQTRGGPMSGAAAAGADRAVVWVRRGESLRPVSVRTGLSDGNNVEILEVFSVEEELKAGDLLAIGQASGDAGGPAGTFSPFGGMSGMGGRGGSGMGGGGGGRGGAPGMRGGGR
ncbi:MAG: efflux RND transporter periplasmic adaptor subunit [Planctomycetes bacterium]|nr:efflux RND transporter periplasmic adaptor subunit [Planctomycetota bacterium]